MTKIKKNESFDYEGRVSISPQEIGYKTYKADTNEVIEIFRELSPEKYKGVVKAFENLTIPESRIAGIKLKSEGIEKYLKEGKVDNFASAVLRGYFKDQPNVKLEIWHPEGLTTFLKYEGCEGEIGYRTPCGGSIYAWENENPDFSLKGFGCVSDLKAQKKRLIEKIMNEENAEHEFERFNHYKKAEETHKQHRKEIITAIRNFREYLPELNTGTIYLKGEDYKEEKIDFRNEEK